MLICSKNNLCKILAGGYLYLYIRGKSVLNSYMYNYIKTTLMLSRCIDIIADIHLVHYVYARIKNEKFTKIHILYILGT